MRAAAKIVTCGYCGLEGHTARDCWVAARRATRPDAIDQAIARLDIVRLRDRPADLRFAISRLVRRAVTTPNP